MLKQVSDTDFETEVLKSEMPAVVDFWAEWCAPCRLLKPTIEELAYELREKAKFYKLNVDENPEATSKYKIMSIPTIIIFKNGKPINQMIGVKSKQELRKFIEENIK